MNKFVKKRIDEHIERGLPITRLIETGFEGDCKCGWCGNWLDDTEKYKPNFCPECGCLLDWTEERLKPCPFCGGKAEEFTNAVYCLKCGCRVVNAKVGDKHYEATELWNSRPIK